MTLVSKKYIEIKIKGKLDKKINTAILIVNL
jgi:hypothetical protein